MFGRGYFDKIFIQKRYVAGEGSSWVLWGFLIHKVKYLTPASVVRDSKHGHSTSQVSSGSIYQQPIVLLLDVALKVLKKNPSELTGFLTTSSKQLWQSTTSTDDSCSSIPGIRCSTTQDTKSLKAGLDFTHCWVLSRLFPCEPAQCFNNLCTRAAAQGRYEPHFTKSSEGPGARQHDRWAGKRPSLILIVLLIVKLKASVSMLSITSLNPVLKGPRSSWVDTSFHLGSRFYLWKQLCTW